MIAPVWHVVQNCGIILKLRENEFGEKLNQSICGPGQAVVIATGVEVPMPMDGVRPHVDESSSPSAEAVRPHVNGLESLGSGDGHVAVGAAAATERAERHSFMVELTSPKTSHLAVRVKLQRLFWRASGALAAQMG